MICAALARLKMKSGIALIALALCFALLSIMFGTWHTITDGGAPLLVALAFSAASVLCAALAQASSISGG